MSDSQAALKALNSYVVSSKLVWECAGTIRQLARHNKVTLMWVPGHEGVEGNELADKLARKGAASSFIGPEPFCGVPTSQLTSDIRSWEEGVKSSHWNSLPGLRHSKKFINPSKKRAEEALSLSKADLRLLTSILTGHCTLRHHLKRMGIGTNSECRFCLEEDETSEHLLCECEATARQRLYHFGRAFMDPSDVAKLSARTILGFIKSLKIEGLH